MDIQFYNTLSQKKELFKPLHDTEVLMYNCGPTVYQYAHLGNLRSYVFADIIKRTLELQGYSVKQVINITDVGHLINDAETGEDKVESEAKKAGKSAREIADFYTSAFMRDLVSLEVETRTISFPRASETIKEQIALILELEKSGNTYTTHDGVYFDTSTFPAYGNLGKINLEGLREGERVAINTEKKNPTDFALWKFSANEGSRLQEWESPWGEGFPGWHIECSAMAEHFLGKTLDIHTGGIDHIPVHHNNEIAQSESAFKAPLARFWMHNAFLTWDGAKMSKSLHNTFTLTDLVEKHISPLAYRYFLLQGHYRTQMNLSFESLEASQNALLKLIGEVIKLEAGGKVLPAYETEFKQALFDDLNTAEALAVLWKLVKDTSVDGSDKLETLFLFDTVLGLGLARVHETVKPIGIDDIPQVVTDLVDIREEARLNKEWQKADALREEIKRFGYDVKDSDTGPTITLIAPPLL